MSAPSDGLPRLANNRLNVRALTALQIYSSNDPVSIIRTILNSIADETLEVKLSALERIADALNYHQESRRLVIAAQGIGTGIKELIQALETDLRPIPSETIAQLDRRQDCINRLSPIKTRCNLWFP